jgi:MazG family protein
VAELDDRTRREFVEPAGPAFERLVEIMAELRAPGGCPWDREQTHATLARHLLEETYEVLEAIDDPDPAALREELGDLVIQIVFHSNIAFEEGSFTIADVLDELREKLIRRHPHVFGDVEASTPDAVKANWERIKRDEKPRGVYEGIPKALPALARATKLARRAATVGFEPWPDIASVLAGLEEELGELRVETEHADPDLQRVEVEVGDVLFAVAALADRLGVEPESALRRMLERSEARMAGVERRARDVGRDLGSLSDDEWRQYWEQAKKENP